MKLKLKCTQGSLAHKMYCKEINISDCYIERHHPTSLLFTTGLLSSKDNYIMIFNNEDMCKHIFDKIVTEDQLIVDINGRISSQPIFENGEYAIFSFQHFMKVKDKIKSNHKVVHQIVDVVKEHSDDKKFIIPKEDKEHFGKDDELTVATIIKMMHSNPRFANWIMCHRFRA